MIFQICLPWKLTKPPWLTYLQGCPNQRCRWQETTATFAVSLRGNFLQMQLNYTGCKTRRCLPRYDFPASFSLSFTNIHWSNQGRYIRRTTIFIFSFCIGLVTQLNGSALGVLKHRYITKRICELLIGKSRFLIYNSLKQLLYYTI